MSISASPARWNYTGDGAQTAFAYTAKVLDQAHMQVFLDDVLQGSGFTVSGIGNASGGNVTFTTAPASAVKVSLVRTVTLDQPTVLPTQGPVPTGTIETQGLDRVVMQVQQLDDKIDRSLVFPPSITLTGTALPAPEASKFLAWNASANGLINSAGTPGTVPVSTFMATLLDDTDAILGRKTLGTFPNNVVAKTAAYTVASGDIGQIHTQSGTYTVTLPAASVGAGFNVGILNVGTGIITLDGNAAETIDGQLTLPLGPGVGITLVSDGSNWIGIAQAGGPVKIEELTASGSVSLDFTASFGLGFDLHEFLFYDIVPATDGSILSLRTSTDGGTGYDAGAGNYKYHIHHMGSTAGTYGASFSNGAVMAQFTSTIGSAAGESLSGRLSLWKPSGTNFTLFTTQTMAVTGAGVPTANVGGGSRVAAADVDAVRFLMSTGNIASGAIHHWAWRG